MADLSYPQALFGAKDAARYLGISETKLRSLGLPRKVLDGRKLYHKPVLDEYIDRLPDDVTENTADAIDW